METVDILGNKYIIKHAEKETVKDFKDEIAELNWYWNNK